MYVAGAGGGTDLSVDEVFESRLARAGVDLVLCGG